jgi:Mg-chelatase subunit ChlI
VRHARRRDRRPRATAGRSWRRRDQRYVEKLATPDVTIADLIGDIDPIKAAKSAAWSWAM